MNEGDDESIARAEYDPETDTYHASFDRNRRYSLLYTIINVVEEVTGQPQSTMEPLFHVVDPDALETLFRTQDEQTARIEFEYGGCTVTALNTGEVTVTILEAS